MKSVYLFMLAAAVFVFFGCTKTAGPAGPAGPQGNANVQTVVFQNQTFTAGATLGINVAAITQNILDSGAVVLTIQETTPSSAAWIALPYSYSGISIVYFIALGKVLITPTIGGTFNVKCEVVAGH